MRECTRGNLLIIGGSEDKHGECIILRKFLTMSGGRQARIAILTTATEYPREVGNQYRELFFRLGAESAAVIYISDRQCANDRHHIDEIERATGIFFTGGDQLRLTSILGGTEVDLALRRSFAKGTVIAGTSAGASVMSDTMIVGGDSSDTPKKSRLSMAHGMGLLNNVVIDQHFAQRGRINRLLEAVAQNPHILGIGIDEDTALAVDARNRCEVVGSQTVTIVDGKNIVHTNVSESEHNDPLAITNLTLHILPAGFGFDLIQRMPYKLDKNGSADSIEHHRGE